MKKKKPTHGGAREGAGRPKKEDTKVMRVPVSKVAIVETLITNTGKKIKVDQAMINELMSDFKNGVWMTIVKVKGKPHIVILPENFYDGKNLLSEAPIKKP